MSANTAKIVILTIVSTAVLLTAYHFCFSCPHISSETQKRSETQQAVAQAASDIEQRQAERSRREMAVAASEISQNEISQNEISQANEQAVKNAVRNKILFEGISSVSGLRTDIAIFLADHGRMPDSLNEIGWEGGVTSVTLSSIRMRVGGILVLSFNPEKLRGTIILTPQTNIEAGMITGWDCTSPDIDFIAEALPECRYQR
ncbi:pilin [Kingella denitrificans]|uniref:pilin n=1 Tax=Kingella denitrificans TaxID=502 RepID=UPI0028D06757|nr:pilin [Kingella denitrificans]